MGARLKPGGENRRTSGEKRRLYQDGKDKNTHQHPPDGHDRPLPRAGGTAAPAGALCPAALGDERRHGALPDASAGAAGRLPRRRPVGARLRGADPAALQPADRDAPALSHGVSMACELAAYGLLAGLLYRRSGHRIFPALIGAMLGGRLVMGLVNTLLYGCSAAVHAGRLPQRRLCQRAARHPDQLILIPSILTALKRSGLAE